MPCWKSVLANRLLAAGLALWCLLVAGVGPARANTSIDLTELQIEQADDGLYLSARLRFDLPAVVEDALYKGIAMYFVADAEVVRKRWYWSDRKLASAHRYMRVAYLPLTRRWRLNTSSEPIVSSGLGVAFTQHYDTLGEAMAAVRRISRWRITTEDALEHDSGENVRFRFRLDARQLPRTLQIGTLGDADWALSIERHVDLAPESEP
jgi:hypothetical protein